jgi:hypothetical protein
MKPKIEECVVGGRIFVVKCLARVDADGDDAS